jgi:hypothetical protein
MINDLENQINFCISKGATETNTLDGSKTDGKNKDEDAKLEAVIIGAAASTFVLGMIAYVFLKYKK